MKAPFIATLLFTCFLFSCQSSRIYNSFHELNNVKKELNDLKNAEVIHIEKCWDGFDLEDLYVRIKIKEKGEIVLSGLINISKNYPKYVWLEEIGGYSFIQFSCGKRSFNPCGAGYGINIGTQRELPLLINSEYKTIQDVIDNYDVILEMFENFKIAPEINYFDTEKFECYLLIYKGNPSIQANIFKLLGDRGLHEYGQSLKWSSNCWYHNP